MRTFRNLHVININVFWSVGLTDDELLEFALAWSYLEHLCINKYWGWGTQMVDGITLDGLVWLLQTCLSLGHLALTINMRGYTQAPLSPPLACLELDSAPATFHLNLVDSVIEAESVLV
jgi:hypothetical protein